MVTFSNEPEPHLREHAGRTAHEAPVQITVVDAVAEEVPSHPAWRTLQRAADATVWPRLSGGCHLARDTDALIEATGFAIERCERFTFRIPPLDPPKTHVLGVARRVQPPGSRPVA